MAAKAFIESSNLSGQIEIVGETIMNQPEKMTQEKSYMEMAIDIAIRIGVLALLIAWCFQILRPFITIVIWGAIIAISFYPICRKLSDLLGNRIKMAASIMIVITLLLIILPSIKMVGSLVDGVTYLNDKVHSGEIKVPPPLESIDSWPVIGKSLKRSWHEASVNLMATLARYAPQLKTISLKLLEFAGLFIGAVILSLGFKLFQAWLETDSNHFFNSKPGET